MHVVVKQNGRTVNEFRFVKGPIHIGRHTNSQILLPDRKVSRQHAVIFATQDGKWRIRDLDSANKTYLNDKAVHEAEIHTGDRLGIGGFVIEIDLEKQTVAHTGIDLEDTLTTAAPKPQVIARKPDAEHAPDIRLAATRIKDFIQATEAICQANGPDEVLKALLSISAKQLDAYHSWCALRNDTSGPMTSHAGKTRDGQKIQLSDIALHKEITQAIERKQFLLFPHVPSHKGAVTVGSAMIAPILGASGCFGVIYVDNESGQGQYSIGDLDYLMLLAIHTAAILENF
jgi:pSer/pThr/pTyr-binding forkhead associated (FHA) protein